MSLPDLNISNPRLYGSDYLIKFILDRSRIKIAYGGRDSSKSHSIAQNIVLNLLNESNCKVVLLRKIYSDIKDSQYQTILDVISSWKLDEYFNAIRNPLEIRCLLNKNIAIARGLDKPSKLKSIKDPTVVWAEEADEITYADFMAVDNSIRSGNPNVLLQLIMSLNPPQGKEHWLLDYFFPPKESYEKPDGSHHFIKSTKKDVCILHCMYDQNRYCSPQRRQRYQSLKYDAPDYYNSQILGLISEKEDTIVFKEWYEKGKFPEENERKKYAIALDFGFTNDPTALVECCLAHGELWFRELCYKTGLVNATQLSDRPSIEKELIRLDINPSTYIYADSAEPKSIEEIKDRNYNIKGVKKPAGSIEASIDKLKSYKINIVSSPNLKKELKNYKYKVDRDGNILNEPVDSFNHCFVGETLVETKRGKIRIDSLRDDDLVLTRKGYFPIKWHRKTRESEVYKVVFSNGSILYGTPNHRIFTLFGEKRIDALRYYDIIISRNKGSILCKLKNFFIKIKNIEDLKTQSHIVIDHIMCELLNQNPQNQGIQQNICIEKFMKIILVKFQKVFMFIIKMGILIIIQLKTLFLYLLINIMKFTISLIKKTIRVFIRSNKKNILKIYDLLRKNGTNQKQEKVGIPNMVKKYGKKENPLLKNVRNVVKNIKIFQDAIIQNFVQIIAKVNGEENQVLMILKKIVNFVKNFLLQINTEKINFAHVNVVVATGKKEWVYNLEVDSLYHEYFANDILVHNCLDSIRYYALGELMENTEIGFMIL